MPDPLKYAVVERERRYLLDSLPGEVTSTHEILDRYVTGTRLRLREVGDSAAIFEWEDEGFALAQELQAHLGDGYRVVAR